MNVAQSQPNAPRQTGTERRALSRRQLRRPIVVRVASADGNDQWSSEGAMLNATFRGIACRIPAEDAAQLPASLRINFELPGGYAGFELAGQVRNVTAAGSPDNVVLGIEFVFEGNSAGEQSRLQRALEAYGGGKQTL